VATLGIRDALVVVGVVVAAVVAGGARSFARIDTRAAGRANLSHLLAGVRLFRRMRVDLLEGVVAQLQPLAVPAGRDVLTQGVDDHGGWYLVEQGRLDVLIDGFIVNELRRGDGFGELALLRDRPRAATVRTVTDVSLLSLDRDMFLSAVGGADVSVSGSFDAGDLRDDDHVEVLARLPLLQGLDRRAVAKLARRSIVHDAPSGTDIVTAGEVDDEYHVLLSGAATVIVGDQRRRQLLPGDGFGEIAVLHRVPRSATVRAEEDCALLTVSGDDLREALSTRGDNLARMAAATAADVSSQHPGG
jgi:CRP-like cAMP-binding protein